MGIWAIIPFTLRSTIIEGSDIQKVFGHLVRRFAMQKEAGCELIVHEECWVKVVDNWLECKLTLQRQAGFS